MYSRAFVKLLRSFSRIFSTLKGIYLHRKKTSQLLALYYNPCSCTSICSTQVRIPSCLFVMPQATPSDHHNFSDYLQAAFQFQFTSRFVIFAIGSSTNKLVMIAKTNVIINDIPNNSHTDETLPQKKKITVCCTGNAHKYRP